MVSVYCPRLAVLLAERVKLGAKTPNVDVVVALNVPEVPVMVTVYCPSGAVLLAVSVKLLELVVGF